MDQDKIECWKKFTKQCPPRLSDLYLLLLELFESILATKYFGEFEKRLQNKISFKNLPLKKLHHLFIFG